MHAVWSIKLLEFPNTKFGGALVCPEGSSGVHYIHLLLYFGMSMVSGSMIKSMISCFTGFMS